MSRFVQGADRRQPTLPLSPPGRTEAGDPIIPEGMSLMRLLEGADGSFSQGWYRDGFQIEDDALVGMGTRQGASVFSTDRQRQIARTLYADGDAAYDLFDDVAGGRYDAVQVTCRPGAPLSASLTLLVGSSAFVQADDMANKGTVKVRQKFIIRPTRTETRH